MQVPVTHEKPNSTMESLVQIRNEFNAKVQDAVAKGDSSKKRRYERQLKQFEDAIKATKEGKTFNYSELTVPPGFAAIPLSNGRPVEAEGNHDLPDAVEPKKSSEDEAEFLAGFDKMALDDATDCNESALHHKPDFNRDLADQDLELCVTRAVNLPVPNNFKQKQITTFVSYEFEFPEVSQQSNCSSGLFTAFHVSFLLAIQSCFQTGKTSKQTSYLSPGKST